MGQYWQVACPDRGEQLSTLLWNKLGCILPGGYAGEHLQQQLMVLTHRQMNAFSGECTSKNLSSEGIESKLRQYLAQLKAENDTLANDDCKSQDVDDMTRPGSPDAEEDVSSLLYEIYSRIWLTENKPCLGEYICKEDIPRLIELLFDTLLGRWAHERIICVGDYSETLPEDYQPRPPVETLYNEEYSEVLSLSDCAKAFSGALESHSSGKAEVFRAEYSRKFEESFPRGDQHVLLNLTSQEYIISDGEFSGNTLDHIRDEKSKSLGDAAMCRICWSQDPSITMNYHGSELVEGPWAGHRFAIISMTAFKKITEDRKGWKNVSEEVYEILDEIWVAEGYS